LLERVFSVDALACPNCGGRMRFIATIDDPRVVRRIEDRGVVPCYAPGAALGADTAALLGAVGVETAALAALRAWG
jgi:hypothetical protein